MSPQQHAKGGSALTPVTDGSFERVADFLTGERVEGLLRQLIGIPSPSLNENRVAAFVEEYLTRAGVVVNRQRVSGGRYNLIAGNQGRGPKRLLLNSHLDTVPIYRAQQQVAVRRGEFIYGRGACDAKGSVAAMLLATAAFARKATARSIPFTLALTVGEENSGDGIAAFVGEHRAFDFCIVGEPSGLALSRTQAGYVEIVVEAVGERSHAFDPRGDQAILAAVKALASIVELIGRKCGRSVRPFVRWIRGGGDDTFWYVRPTCAIAVLVNVFPDESIRPFVARVRAEMQRLNRRLVAVRVRARVVDWDTGIDLERGFWGLDLLRGGLRAAGVRPREQHLPSWTDASALTDAGIPTVVFGPGVLRDAHSGSERVRVRDVWRAARALLWVVMRHAEGRSGASM